MQVGVDVTCIHTSFSGRGFSGFEDKNSSWSIKVENLINRNRLKKIMQIGVDDKCMHTNFDGCDLSGFGDIATFKNDQISPSTHGL